MWQEWGASHAWQKVRPAAGGRVCKGPKSKPHHEIIHLAFVLG